MCTFTFWFSGLLYSSVIVLMMIDSKYCTHFYFYFYGYNIRLRVYINKVNFFYCTYSNIQTYMLCLIAYTKHTLCAHKCSNTIQKYICLYVLHVHVHCTCYMCITFAGACIYWVGATIWIVFITTIRHGMLCARECEPINHIQKNCSVKNNRKCSWEYEKKRG